jgi:hypothetical protein
LRAAPLFARLVVFNMIPAFGFSVGDFIAAAGKLFRVCVVIIAST